MESNPWKIMNFKNFLRLTRIYVQNHAKIEISMSKVKSNRTKFKGNTHFVGRKIVKYVLF